MTGPTDFALALHTEHGTDEPRDDDTSDAAEVYADWARDERGWDE